MIVHWQSPGHCETIEDGFRTKESQKSSANLLVKSPGTPSGLYGLQTMLRLCRSMKLLTVGDEWGSAKGVGMCYQHVRDVQTDWELPKSLGVLWAFTKQNQ